MTSKGWLVSGEISPKASPESEPITVSSIALPVPTTPSFLVAMARTQSGGSGCFSVDFGDFVGSAGHTK